LKPQLRHPPIQLSGITMAISSASIKPSVLSPDSVLTEAHWQVIFALLDAVVPSVVADDSPVADRGTKSIRLSPDEFQDIHKEFQRRTKSSLKTEDFQEFMASLPSDNPNFVDCIKRSISGLSSSSKTQLCRILTLILLVQHHSPQPKTLLMREAAHELGA
jgi:hypothetical protein